MPHLLNTLIESLANDKTSADVRASVVQAIDTIISNPLSHSFIKKYLPKISKMIHDTTEKVRLAMVKMLLTINSIKLFPFYDIVEMDHLLVRLEVDTSLKVKNGLVKLLADTYFPYGKKSSKQMIRRCIALVKSNPVAARVFYSGITEHVPCGPIVNFMIKMWKNCISKWIEQKKLSDIGGDNEEEMIVIEYESDKEETKESKKSKKDSEKSGESKKSSKKESKKTSEKKKKKSGKSSAYLSLKDVKAVSVVLEILANLWNGIVPSLKKKREPTLSSVSHGNI